MTFNSTVAYWKTRVANLGVVLTLVAVLGTMALSPLAIGKSGSDDSGNDSNGSDDSIHVEDHHGTEHEIETEVEHGKEVEKEHGKEIEVHDGSDDHPFATIEVAAVKAKKENRPLFLHNGTYEDNLELDGVVINGENKEKVIIIAKDEKKPAITLKNGAELRKVTVIGGEVGVLVEKDSAATIDQCVISDNATDGISIESAATDNKHRVDIFNSTITNNGWNGIFGEKRKFRIVNNVITDNGIDGIEFKKGAEGDITDNKIKRNVRDGLKLTLDKSDIFTKKNTFEDNGRNGLDITVRGVEGEITVKKSKFYKNQKNGIMRVEKASFSDHQWEKSLIIHDNAFSDNKKDNISDIKSL